MASLVKVPEVYLDINPQESPGNSTTESLYGKFRETRYFGSLDGVRALCILAVIFHHVPFSANLPKILHRGFLGVDGFFVLSGLLIETLILREKSKTGSFFLTNFYISRSLRIFPIYYLLLFGFLVGLGLTRPHSSSFKAYLSELPYYLTYTCNWILITGVNKTLWSLATEEQFYLVWPLIEKYCRPALCFFFLMLGFVLNQMFNFGVFQGWVDRVYPSGAPIIILTTFTPIILGVFLARLLHSPRWFATLSPLIGRKASPLALACVLFGICWFAPEDLSGWPRLLIQITMALLIGSLMIREDHYAAGFLRFAPIHRLGVVSYGAYLYQMMAIHVVRESFKQLGTSNPWLILVGTVLVTWAMAEVSYRLVEIRMLQYKETWTRDRVGIITTVQRKLRPSSLVQRP